MTRIYLSPPDVGPLEREYLLRAFDSGWIAPIGPDLDAFEREIADLTGWAGAVALSSGTAALHLALLVTDVQPGDAVMVSTFTFVATANAIVHCGANPIFIDSEPATWNMSPQLLADALAHARRHNRLPKAIVVVDLYGQCADYDEIVPMCQELGIPVVEDAAEALGATYKGCPAGTLGDIGIFSFNGNKIITTSGGGMVVTLDSAVADQVRYLATQARQPTEHYEHTEVGFNYRLSNVLAALGRAQLKRLPEMSARRRAINEHYVKRLGDLAPIDFMPVPIWDGWNGWLTCVVFDHPAARDTVQAALAEAEVESRPLWKPMHLQPVYASHDSVVNGTSQRLFEQGLCLPSGSSLADDDIDRICQIVRASVTSGP